MSTTPVVVAGRVDGVLGPWAPGFEEWLVSRGYAAETVAGYLRWLGWLGGWLAGRGLAADALTGALAAQFAASMRAAGHPKITAGRLATMLGYLREAGAVPPEDPCPSAVTPRERVLAAYRETWPGGAWLLALCPPGCAWPGCSLTGSVVTQPRTAWSI
jgi:hypothetical protein